MQKCVRKAVLKDCLDLAPKMRLADRREIRASDNASPLQALVLPFTYEGARNYTILGTEEEGVIGMFGTTPCDFKKDYGVAWMLSSVVRWRPRLARQNHRQDKRVGLSP